MREDRYIPFAIPRPRILALIDFFISFFFFSFWIVPLDFFAIFFTFFFFTTFLELATDCIFFCSFLRPVYANADQPGKYGIDRFL